MKAKKIPRSVKFWLVLLGFWGGNLAILIGIAISYVVPTLGFGIIGASLVGSLAVWYLISWKWRSTLEEWGCIESRKEKHKR